MPMLSKKRLQAKQMQQLAVDRHVMGLMHEMLRHHLEATGKFTAEERTIWERDFMVPEMARHGFDVSPVIKVPVPPPAPRLLTAPSVITGPTVERIVGDVSQLHH